MENFKEQLVSTGESVSILPVAGCKPITVIGNTAIRETFDDATLQQAVNTCKAPGVTKVVINADAHRGYGTPIGCVMVSPSHIYPGPVGVDIKCSMSLLQLDLPQDAVADKSTRLALINAIAERVPTGAGKGQRNAIKSRSLKSGLGEYLVTEGLTEENCFDMGVPPHWALRCEDSAHLGHNGTKSALWSRLRLLRKSGALSKFDDQMRQLGSLGGGNHFGECNIVKIKDNDQARKCAEVFGLKDNSVCFLTHCGSRGFGHNLAMAQFKALQDKFKLWNTPFPGEDKELCYAPLWTQEANDYLDDMALGANFATANHMMINALVLEAFQEVIPGVKGELVYFISHNIARKEVIDNVPVWVMRKGATRAVPAGHYSLNNTPYKDTGHPILLPGDPQRGSAVMVAQPGAALTCYSVNHGAGRLLGRRHANRTLNQEAVNTSLEASDVMSNCKNYPMDESPAAYKDFNEVLKSVESAGLATAVARLKAKFVIKDSSQADD